MKKTQYMKRALLQATFFTTVLLIMACDNSQQQKDTKEVAKEQNDSKFDNNKREKDAQFLVNAAEINLEEIKLGQLAQQKGGTGDVQKLGKMMEDVHTKSQRELTALAKSKNISIPTAPTNEARDAYEKLADKSGKDFDNAYADMMVSGHKDAINTFEQATTDSYDRDIKNWAIASLPALRKHLNHSVDYQNTLDKFKLTKN